MIKIINYLKSINVACVFKKSKMERGSKGEPYHFNVYTLSNGYEIMQNDRNFILRKNNRRLVFCQYEDDFVHEIKRYFENREK